jgi:hypothetical protein
MPTREAYPSMETHVRQAARTPGRGTLRAVAAASVAPALLLAPVLWAGTPVVATPQFPPDPAITLEQLKAAEEFAGPEGKIVGASVLISLADGDFERMVLCVAHKPDGSTALIDSVGTVYAGDMDDYRSDNVRFSEDDQLTFNRHIMDPDPPENVDVITVSGHTTDWTPWYLGGGIVLAAVFAGGARLALRRSRGGTEPFGGAPA